MKVIPPMIVFALSAIPNAFATTVQVEPTVIAEGLQVVQRLETLEADNINVAPPTQTRQSNRLTTVQPAQMQLSEYFATEPTPLDQDLATAIPAPSVESESHKLAQQIQIKETNPDQALAQIASLLSDDVNNADQIIQSAMESMPEFAEQIAQLARDNGIENEVITTAALLAGIDPTRIAEATAAGISRIAAVAPPATPSIGGNGGGGIRVVSPN